MTYDGRMKKLVAMVAIAVSIVVLVIILTAGSASAGKRCVKIGGLRWCYSVSTKAKAGPQTQFQRAVRDLVGGRSSHSHAPAFTQVIFHLSSGDVVCTHNANAIVVDCN